MGDGTGIEWCDASWPVVNGCRRVSPGCENCYAERLIATRLSKQTKYRGLAVYKASGPRWTGESRLWSPHLDWPLRWKAPRKVFVADMGDLFFEAVTNEEIAAVFGVMAACPQHTFQVLTKRPERMRDWFRWLNARADLDTHCPWTEVHWAALQLELETVGDSGPIHCGSNCHPARPWPLPNVWLGVSVEDQQRADERIPVLLDTPAAVRWVSAEPLLGPVDLTQVDSHNALTGEHLQENAYTRDWPGLDWVIVGGESGPGARSFDLAWARRVVEQCKHAEVPVFVKQLGAAPIGVPIDEHGFERTVAGGDKWPPVPLRLRSRKGGDMAEWPEDLRVRQFPEVRA